MSDLRSKTHTSGRSTALANVTEDRSMMFFLLFSLPRLTITADVIEFLDEDELAEKPMERVDAPTRTRPPGVDEASWVRWAGISRVEPSVARVRPNIIRPSG